MQPRRMSQLIYPGCQHSQNRMASEIVFLNIYDLDKVTKHINKVFKHMGTGVYHVGVQVFGREWSYGQTFDKSTGINWGRPRHHVVHQYRTSVVMGHTILTQHQVYKLIELSMGMWMGQEYNLLSKNCINFAEWLLIQLGIDSAIPSYVRAAPIRALSMTQTASNLWQSISNVFSNEPQYSKTSPPLQLASAASAAEAAKRQEKEEKKKSQNGDNGSKGARKMSLPTRQPLQIHNNSLDHHHHHQSASMAAWMNRNSMSKSKGIPPSPSSPSLIRQQQEDEDLQLERALDLLEEDHFQMTSELQQDLDLSNLAAAVTAAVQKKGGASLTDSYHSQESYRLNQDLNNSPTLSTPLSNSSSSRGRSSFSLFAREDQSPNNQHMNQSSSQCHLDTVSTTCQKSAVVSTAAEETFKVMMTNQRQQQQYKSRREIHVMETETEQSQQSVLTTTTSNRLSTTTRSTLPPLSSTSEDLRQAAVTATSVAAKTAHLQYSAPSSKVYNYLIENSSCNMGSNTASVRNGYVEPNGPSQVSELNHFVSNLTQSRTNATISSSSMVASCEKDVHAAIPHVPHTPLSSASSNFRSFQGVRKSTSESNNHAASLTPSPSVSLNRNYHHGVANASSNVLSSSRSNSSRTSHIHMVLSHPNSNSSSSSVVDSARKVVACRSSSSKSINVEHSSVYRDCDQSLASSPMETSYAEFTVPAPIPTAPVLSVLSTSSGRIPFIPNDNSITINEAISKASRPSSSLIILDNLPVEESIPPVNELIALNQNNHRQNLGFGNRPLGNSEWAMKASQMMKPSAGDEIVPLSPHHFQLSSSISSSDSVHSSFEEERNISNNYFKLKDSSSLLEKMKVMNTSKSGTRLSPVKQHDSIQSGNQIKKVMAKTQDESGDNDEWATPLSSPRVSPSIKAFHSNKNED